MKFSEIPKCVCGKITTFRKSKSGEIYPANCSLVCRSMDKRYTDSISKRKSELYADPDWKEKVENKKTATTLKNFGVKYPMQDVMIFEKQQASCFRKDENGLHGYEPHIFPFLKNLYDDIELGTEYLRSENIKIQWTGSDEKIHRSYPDFFSKTINSFIEVKSQYTFSLHRDKLVKCKDRLCEMGYGYITIVVNPKRSFVMETHNLEFIED